ncbi:MAG: NADH-quinone oxidoreductase subunit M [Bacteroidota bacterium]
MITGLLFLIPLLATPWVMASTGDRAIWRNALIASLIEFFASLLIFLEFRNSGASELIISFPWISSIGVHFSFGMDGLSVLLVLLTTFLTPIIILASSGFNARRLNIYFGLILLMEMAMIGVFTARDGLVFYLFWEMALIPIYFITAIWGGANRIRITFKFLIYTLSGSLIMLVALIYVYYQTPYPHSFDFQALYHASLTIEAQRWVFAAFFLAFAIKIPIFPFHTWQPDTYTEAPAASSMLLAGIMLKMGIYGILRLLIPLCPLAFGDLALPAILLSVTGIIYASIIAIRQKDLKRMIAYASIAHVGLIAAGLFSLKDIALQGAVIQMFSHGINVVGLFILIDIIENRFHSRRIDHLGGIAQSMPRFSIIFLIILLGSIALPLTNGFVGEFLLLLGLFQYSPWLSLAAGSTIIFGAVYMLWMYQRVMYGNLPVRLVEKAADLSNNEMFALIPLVIMVLWIGWYPKPFLLLAEPAIRTILNIAFALPN